ncbi:MAG: hypothetical protein WCD79_12650 [Chthoniobacteraceae bacterium]
MNTPLTTLEQQRAYLRRLEEGWAAASADQAETSRNLTDAERWRIADELQQFAEMFPSPPPPEIPHEEHGMVQMQRYFMKMHRQK